MPKVKHISRLLLSLCLSALALMLVGGFLVAARAAQASRVTATNTLDRDLEPVVVTGVFPGAPVNQVFVYRESGGVWEQIPFQIDEVTASGSYTVTEDGLLDGNDEVVFMASDLGDEATTPITATLPISPSWYKVEVTDPLSPTKKGWAYIVRSSVLAYTGSADYADYITASLRISATNYGVGWAASHSGQDYMSLFGGADILDRTKLRVYYRFLGLPFTLTENSSMPPVVVLRDGPVRVIASRGASLTRAYGSFLQTTTPVDLTSLDFITIDELRISTDLTNTITNGTYYNENVPGGVTIDGITDTVPATPFVNAWRQVSLDDGTTIQVVDLGALDGTPSHYYRDDGVTVVDGADTGDQRSFGDSGVRVISPTATLFTVESAQFVLPGRQANRGAEFYAYFRNPLLVSIRAEGEQYVYLPLIMNSAGAQGQIDPFVLDELAAKGRVNVFVKMVEEAALETDEQGVSPMERVQAVHDRLTVQATSSQENITRFLDSQGIPYTSFWINNSLYVYQADLALVRALAQRGDVAYVRGDHQVPRLLPIVHDPAPQHATVEWGLQTINADDVWATGHTGQGVVVASIDTGVRYTHEALVNQYRGNNGDGTFSHDYNWWDPLRTYAAPTDLSGHGTHTMGTMVGGDAFGPLTPDVGVAPGAQWIAAKGCGLIFCSDFALISSAQWIACPTRLDGSAPDCSKAPQVVNNSWGTRAGDPFYLSYVRAWLAAGIVPVFAIGNGGPGCRTATSPGDYRYVIGVGATNQDDVLAFFSSRGPGFFRWLKPDFVAPGAWVRSAFHTGDAAYAVLSGTSMAAPHVSGTIALMLSAHPDARLASLYKGLYTTAVTDLGNPPGRDACAGRRYDLYPNTTYGWGRIDALAAVNALP